jgi:hypothetical protein
LQTTLSTYGTIASNLTRSLSTTAAKPQVAREAAYYLANIGNVKSIDDFLGYKRLFTFAMKAYGLQDMTYAKAFMRKVLTEGTDKDNSFANTLSDKRYQQFAETFNFARYGATTTIFDRTRQGTVTTTCARPSKRMQARRTRGCALPFISTARPGIFRAATASSPIQPS